MGIYEPSDSFEPLSREDRMNTRQPKSLIINFLLPNQKKRATNRALNEQPHHVCLYFDGFNERRDSKCKKKDSNLSVHGHSAPGRLMVFNLSVNVPFGSPIGSQNAAWR